MTSGIAAGPVHTPPVLHLDGLRVRYRGLTRGEAPVTAVDDLSLTLARGETVAIVGESGSGKSTTLHALLGLAPRSAAVEYRGLRVAGEDGVLREVADPQALRGGAVALVPQDPVRALDPLVRIEGHFRELHRHFAGITDREASRRRTIASLESVGVDRPAARLRQYPHELSGGLRQRILIALALIGEPRLLLADEPTSNLDATVQRRVLDLIDEVRAERDLSVLLVTHDIAVAAERSTRLVVMRGGRVVETGPTEHVIADPADTYTRQLLSSLPSRLPARAPRPVGAEPPILEASGLGKTFASGRGQAPLAAVEDLSLTVHRGRTVALVGESGAGKSTALRLLTGLEHPDRGQVLIDGRPVSADRSSRSIVARKMQLVYQNPGRSLNPDLSVVRAIAEPLEALGIGDRASRVRRAHDLLAEVGLPGDLASRRPHELSGGQQQRVAIARALAPQPEIVVLDEPVSALDQSVQFALLSLLIDLQARLGVSYVLVSHDLGVVRAIADDVLVLHRGRVVDSGPTDTVFTSPASVHTQTLIDAVPSVQLPVHSLAERTS